MSATVFDKIDETVALSPVGAWFRLEGCGHPKARTGSRFLVS
jgi:AGZA family xanthine/uracil permease-like MFS transporter